MGVCLLLERVWRGELKDVRPWSTGGAVDEVGPLGSVLRRGESKSLGDEGC